MTPRAFYEASKAGTAPVFRRKQVLVDSLHLETVYVIYEAINTLGLKPSAVKSSSKPFIPITMFFL